MAPKPTLEQGTIIDTFVPGDKNLVVEAGAGCGKTSVLKMAARAVPKRKGLYIAYNKAIQVEAAKSFPDSVTCKTSHGLAFGAVGRQYAHRLKAPRMKSEDVAKLLKINDPIYAPNALIPPAHVARIVMSTVATFTRSARTNILHQPVPRIPGLDDPDTMQTLAAEIPLLAAKAWEDIRDPRGRLPFSHDCYLKMWCLSGPQLTKYDYILLDEAQDSNPPVAKMVEAQRHAQLVLVGDPSQSIYGWRGAEDAMSKFNGVRLTLSQSFRFGEVVAEEANLWLGYLNAPLRLRGFEQINSRLATLTEPDAILCRTNGTAIAQVMEQLNAGRRVSLVGGGDQIRKLAEAAMQLKDGRGCSHPELFAFKTWAELQEYIEEDEGSDLRPFVNLIDAHGADVVLNTVSRLVPSDRADVEISTAHKAKGREWRRVKVADDFPEPKPTDDDKPGRISRPDAMLAYVTVTRAQYELDNTGLNWIRHYL
ncbi:UvrD-helicase domain-containing protein [Nonomuraea cavernae]|uniref:DNA helicase n=1 Tax=Nonomuraea cavernae TaxID=2045107 RepID=A0A918DG33_9ACTN|nr:UvrD-helicase domain-containing protein [Nonomuraea cavernae]MCA2184722.1 UvrD-helicase domain-containing protein [Nonomuraea cavernae]GGO62956.1 DNA helicase [Nonomuraea cavernae]